MSLTDMVPRCRPLALAAHGLGSCLSARTQPLTATGAPSQTSRAMPCHAFTEGCPGANDKASPPGRHQEQAPKQRCTFRPTAFSSVQFSSVATLLALVTRSQERWPESVSFHYLHVCTKPDWGYATVGSQLVSGCLATGKWDEGRVSAHASGCNRRPDVFCNP